MCADLQLTCARRAYRDRGVFRDPRIFSHRNAFQIHVLRRNCTARCPDGRGIPFVYRASMTRSRQPRPMLPATSSVTLQNMGAADSFCRALVDNASEAISLLTPDGTVLDVNRRWEEIRQIPRCELI